MPSDDESRGEGGLQWWVAVDTTENEVITSADNQSDLALQLLDMDDHDPETTLLTTRERWKSRERWMADGE